MGLENYCVTDNGLTLYGDYVGMGISILHLISLKVSLNSNVIRFACDMDQLKVVKYEEKPLQERIESNDFRNTDIVITIWN